MPGRGRVVSGDRLTPLQWRILRALASLDPAWTLSGGAALAGFHLKHRPTRDLDLFWRGRKDLGSIPRTVETVLRAEELAVHVLQTAPTFYRLSVAGDAETCVVDLVAEPAAALEPPMTFPVAAVVLAVDTPHEILVTKLCTLLSRAEIRDLVDVQALLAAGGDLDRACTDAPRKDTGFSALTLSWVLNTTDLRAMAKATGLGLEETAALDRFRSSLIERLLAVASPE
jgi:hypothetical protein